MRKRFKLAVGANLMVLTGGQVGRGAGWRGGGLNVQQFRMLHHKCDVTVLHSMPGAGWTFCLCEQNPSYISGRKLTHLGLKSLANLGLQNIEIEFNGINPRVLCKLSIHFRG